MKNSTFANRNSKLKPMIMNLRRLTMVMTVWMAVTTLNAQSVREAIRLDEGWKFAFGNAADPAKDFGCGTEYFNYLTKANSIHNEGPYSPKFDDSKWEEVRVPHDWATTLPYAEKASHSHGYKTVGYQYPETSVGWYRKTIKMEELKDGRTAELPNRYYLQFDGIFRNARVWFNGFYLGTEPSGYATQVYDVTEYVNYGGDNLICVRADATLEEGWFYEGAGIYRDAWLVKTAAVSVAPFGTFVYADLKVPYDQATIHVETEVNNHSLTTQQCEVSHRLLDANGGEVAKTSPTRLTLKAKQRLMVHGSRFMVQGPHLWSPESPYLYKVVTTIRVDNKVVDEYVTTTGVREVVFDTDKGFRPPEAGPLLRPRQAQRTTYGTGHRRQEAAPCAGRGEGRGLSDGRRRYAEEAIPMLHNRGWRI